MFEALIFGNNSLVTRFLNLFYMLVYQMSNTYYNYNTQSIRQGLSQGLSSMLLKLQHAPIILCVGSDKVTGDSLGPLTGYMLTDIYNVSTYVYGTLNAPVTASNLSTTVAFIKTRHPNRKILVIDASIGNRSHIGLIRLAKGGIYPGAGNGKSFEKVGNIAITATVSEYTQNLTTACFVPLGLVVKLADIISSCIAGALSITAPFVAKSSPTFRLYA